VVGKCLVRVGGSWKQLVEREVFVLCKVQGSSFDEFLHTLLSLSCHLFYSSDPDQQVRVDEGTPHEIYPSLTDMLASQT
jgi:hypothetical protein